MKNKREIYEALIAGRKVRHLAWKPGVYVKFNAEGNLVNQDNLVVAQEFSSGASNWEIVQESEVYEVEVIK